METNFFDFLTNKKASFTMSHAQELAKGIASSYLNSGFPPTESLVKVAQEESLTPDQIAVVATETNRTIHNVKYAGSGEKYHAADFPLADAKKVIDGLQKHADEVKVAGAFSEPNIPENSAFFEQFNKHLDLDNEFIEKIAHDEKSMEVKSHLKIVEERTVHLLDKVNDALIMGKFACQDSEQTFIKMAREGALQYGDNAEQRAKYIGFLDHMFKTAKMKNVSRAPLAKLAVVLAKEGMIMPTVAKEAIGYFMSKEADQKAPDGLISENLDGVDIVNGQNPLYIELETLKNLQEEQHRTRNKFKIVRDTLGNVEQRIRAL